MRQLVLSTQHRVNLILSQQPKSLESRPPSIHFAKKHPMHMTAGLGVHLKAAAMFSTLHTLE